MSNEEQNPASCQTAVISWVAVSEKLPTVVDNGKKVLIYRIMNESQSSLAISIHETNMVKHCNPNETWWMELPKPPCFSPDFELKFCDVCFQMTNHLDGKCQKCKANLR